VERRHVKDGWQTRWVIYLDGPECAEIELAMQALREVVAGAGDIAASGCSSECMGWN
jgi:hypothetical protein